MKLAAVALALFTASTFAAAAEPAARSPYDTNPRCRERTTDADDPECTLQFEGDARQTYPPGKRPPKVSPPPPPPLAPEPPSPPKASARDSGKPGGGAAK